jgi:hypothetical protein
MWLILLHRSVPNTFENMSLENNFAVGTRAIFHSIHKQLTQNGPIAIRLAKVVSLDLRISSL